MTWWINWLMSFRLLALGLPTTWKMFQPINNHPEDWRAHDQSPVVWIEFGTREGGFHHSSCSKVLGITRTWKTSAGYQQWWAIRKITGWFISLLLTIDSTIPREEHLDPNNAIFIQVSTDSRWWPMILIFSINNTMIFNHIISSIKSYFTIISFSVS